MTKVIHWKTLLWDSHMYETSDWTVLLTKNLSPFRSWEKNMLCYICLFRGIYQIRPSNYYHTSPCFNFSLLKPVLLVHYMMPPPGIEKNTCIFSKVRTCLLLSPKAYSVSHWLGVLQPRRMLQVPSRGVLNHAPLLMLSSSSPMDPRKRFIQF